MSDFRFVSINTLDHVSLHDCIIKNVKFLEKQLIFSFDHIDVLPTHPLNPFEKPKYTDKAVVVFEDAIILESILFDTSNIRHLKAIVVERDAKKKEMDIIDLAENFEVSKCTQNDSKSDYLIEGFSWKYQTEFGQFLISCKQVKVYWNELLADAWFA
jgi:hypothetical protein